MALAQDGQDGQPVGEQLLDDSDEEAAEGEDAIFPAGQMGAATAALAAAMAAARTQSRTQQPEPPPPLVRRVLGDGPAAAAAVAEDVGPRGGHGGIPPAPSVSGRLAASVESSVDRVVAAGADGVMAVWHHPWAVVARRFLLWVVVAAVVAQAVVALATCCYFVFYYLYVPAPKYELPLYFDFGTRSPLGEPATSLQLAHGGGDRLLARNQGYNFFVDLTLPRSPANERAGMFMVTLILGSTYDEVTGIKAFAPIPTQAVITDKMVALARPARLPYQSWVAQVVSSTVWLVPNLLGVTHETDRVTVPLFYNRFDRPHMPFSWAAVALSEHTLEVTDATLRIEAHMTGLTYLMYNWFFSSSVVGITTLSVFFGVSCLLLALCYFWLRHDNVPAPAPQQDVHPAPRPPDVFEVAAADPALVFDEALGVYVHPPQPDNTPMPETGAAAGLGGAAGVPASLDNGVDPPLVNGWQDEIGSQAQDDGATTVDGAGGVGGGVVVDGTGTVVVDGTGAAGAVVVDGAASVESVESVEGLQGAEGTSPEAAAEAGAVLRRRTASSRQPQQPPDKPDARE
eukprot:m.363838 g.363838  ORF g.363838 m.363838 type:complete len:570 (-) comp19963_c0_seq62:4243-5952(-)